MKLVHVIQSKDVGHGVYRHPFGSAERSLLVAIHRKFGGIGPRDVGRRIYQAADGQLVWGEFEPERSST